ncbi:hypothetical protein HTZ77_25030 [Nonomuraea sp. SMC257]|uniref:Uncharacterized protein n=1 Tax=Nonomuraea montanisoli TaxID=2741721 RepID=A0A7Y6IAI2_9ACTN|nr:hypothetical protein [Nonomuraea montanisoli]NUW34672.1 hypothetical protein [Nonomuraea montanisoli]
MRLIPALLAASTGALLLTAPAGATTKATTKATTNATAQAVTEPTEEELRAAPIAEEAEAEVKLALLRYSNGLTVEFNDSQPSGDVGIVQTAYTGRAGLFVRDRGDSFLETYLKITPVSVAVPQRLVEAHGSEPLPAELQRRTVTKEPVEVDGLAAPAVRTMSGAVNCNKTYYPWYHWRDVGHPGMLPRDSYSSSYGGKYVNADSWLVHCLPAGHPPQIAARHRFFYFNNVLSKWVEQSDTLVYPGQEQHIEKGIINRYRRIIQDDSWGSDPDCTSCTYTREGRFHD